MRRPEKCPIVLAIATEWRSGRGGLSTLNRSLCIALAKRGADVYCVIPQVDEPDRRTAREVGVHLIEPPIPTGRIMDSVRLHIPLLLSQHVPNIVIGHGRITGQAAETQAAHFSAIRVHILHMSPADIEREKHHDPFQDVTAKIAIRQSVELQLARDADIVAAIGPRLAYDYGTLLHGKKSVHTLLPGLPDIAVTTGPPPSPRCLVLGRFDDQKDWSLKGLDIAARAVGVAARQLGVSRPEVTLVVRGAAKGNGDALYRYLIARAGTNLNIDVRPFSSNASEIESDLLESSCLLMPSRKEGFGLVALEAISARVPVLLSGNSGVAESIQGIVQHLANDLVIVPAGDDDQTVAAWSCAVLRILSDRGAAFDRATSLWHHLSKEFVWNTAADKLLELSAQAQRENGKRCPTSSAVMCPAARPRESESNDASSLDASSAFCLKVGRHQTNFVPIDNGTGLAAYLPGCLTCEINGGRPPLPADIQILYDEASRMPLEWDQDMCGVLGYEIGMGNGLVGPLTLNLRLYTHGYHLFQSTVLSMPFVPALRRHLVGHDPRRRPIPYLATGLGIVLVVHTADGKILLALRKDAHIRAGERDVGVVQGIDCRNDGAPPNFAAAACRGIEQKLGVSAEASQIEFLGFGVDLQWYQFNLLGLVRLRQSSTEVEAARIRNSLRRREFDVEAVDHDPLSVFTFVKHAMARGEGPWSTALASTYYGLVRLQGERESVERAAQLAFQ